MVQPLIKYFFSEISKETCLLLRVAYGTLLLINVLFWFPDLSFFFGEQGYFSYDLSRQIFGQELFSFFAFLPEIDVVFYTAYFIFLAQICCLIAGFYFRFNAISCFLWLTSFTNQNPFIWDGEDIVFSILGFLIIFLPADRRDLGSERVFPIWPLRLIQAQIALIYLSTALMKLSGETWRDGSALYYAFNMRAAYPRIPLPDFIVESVSMLKLMTWGVLGIEIILPLALLIKPLRKIGLGLAFLLHLGLEVSMDLFLFQWIMFVGLISFWPEDWTRKLTSILPRGLFKKRQQERLQSAES